MVTGKTIRNYIMNNEEQITLKKKIIGVYIRG